MKSTVRAKKIVQKLHWQQGWEEPLVNIAKSYQGGVAYLYVLMRHLTIITSLKEILETRNSF